MTEKTGDLKRRSFLGQARGFGSAKSGTHHWWMQRLTSVALVILGGWFFYSFLTQSLGSYTTAIDWLQSPITMALLSLFLFVGLYHCFLGLQVVIEDYVHTEGVKITLLIALKLAFWALALASVYSLIKIQLVPGTSALSSAISCDVLNAGLGEYVTESIIHV